jgi:hypothetical protein
MNACMENMDNTGAAGVFLFPHQIADGKNHQRNR